MPATITAKSVLALDPTGTLPDPGQWIAVVPEPGSLALLALGGLLVAQRRRSA